MRASRRVHDILERLKRVVLILVAACVALSAQTFQPARYQSGALPSFSPLALAGGEVMLELTVGSDGAVRGVRALRVTAPYTDALASAVKTWRFAPARVEGAVESSVLVVGIFRAPTLNVPTLGDLPRDVGSESDQTPFPVATTVPLYPPLARMGGLVLIETEIDVNGRPHGSRVIQSSPPFYEPALGALQQWLFRPARIAGRSTPTMVYVVFGFPQPVTGPMPGAPATPPPQTAPAGR